MYRAARNGHAGSVITIGSSSGEDGDEATRVDRCPGIAQRHSIDPCVAGIRHFRRPHQLWSKPDPRFSPGGRVRGKDSQRGQARGSAGPAGNDLRARHQPQDRQGPRPQRAAHDAHAGRRSHRVSSGADRRRTIGGQKRTPPTRAYGSRSSRVAERDPAFSQFANQSRDIAREVVEVHADHSHRAGYHEVPDGIVNEDAFARLDAG